MLITEGTDFIKDFVVDENTISFLGKRTLFTINRESLTMTKEREFGGAYSNVGLSTFIDPNDFVLSDGNFIRVQEFEKDHLFIANTASKVIEFDSNLEILKIHRRSDFFELIQAYNDLYLIRNEKSSIIINDNGEKVYNKNLTERARFENGFLIDYADDTMTLIDLSSF